MEINSTYDEISPLILSNSYSSYMIDTELQNLASGGNIVLTVIDNTGKQLNAVVFFDADKNDILQPKPTGLFDITSNSSPSDLINIPMDVLYEIAIKISLSEILNTCLSNKYLKENICDRDEFWKRKFVHDFGPIKKIVTTVEPMFWKNKYKNYRKTYSFGGNKKGQLGTGNYRQENSPIEVNLHEDVRTKSISAGHRYSLVIGSDDNVYSFGINDSGQLGTEDYKSRNSPVKINLPEDIKIKSISAGGYHSLMIDINGEVYSFGYNKYGQLGIGSDNKYENTPQKIDMFSSFGIGAKEVSTGWYHSLILGTDSNLYSFGYNTSGQLGAGDFSNRDRPIRIIMPGGVKIKAISAGGYHSLVLGMDNKAYSFGLGKDGSLGLGPLPLNPPSLINIPTEIHTPKNVGVKSISSGGTHSLILGMDSKVYSFGYNIVGQLGMGETKINFSWLLGRQLITEDKNIFEPTEILPPEPGLKFKKISAGGYFSLILGENNKIYSFGRNKRGELGLGDNTTRFIPTEMRLLDKIEVKDISAGEYHALIIIE